MVKINTNIFAMMVQRNISNSTQQLQQSEQRLSSGLRINSAADDPAGLSASERTQYEIAGARQNQQNVSNATSLIGTGESYLSSITTLLQRARELSVQAGSDTLSQSNRDSIQAEINQLTSEIDRISTTASFNGQSLLNGQLKNASLQIGTNAGDTLSLTLGDYRIATLGAQATISGTASVAAAPLAAGAVTLNGLAVPASVTDGVSTSNPAGSALAKVAAINSISSQTGVQATALATTLSGTAAIQAVALNASTQQLQINGVAITGVNVQAGDSNQALVQAINGKTGQTGVTASVDTATGQLTLTAADGRNIQVFTSGGVGGSLGLAAPGGDVNTTQTGSIQLTSVRTFTLGDAAGQLGFGAGTTQVNPDPTTALKNISVANSAAASSAIITIDAALAQVSDGEARIGAVSNRLAAIGSTLAQRVNDLTSANSTISDTDFAYETARMTQNQILQNAGIAMLAQANVTPKQALDLLQH